MRLRVTRLQILRSSYTQAGGGEDTPPTAIFFNGVPILYNGNFLTYN